MKRATLSTRIGAMIVGAALAGSLAACSGESTPRTPPPPPQMYTVKHMTADGTVLATYLARRAFAEGGCVKFELPGDPTSMAYRVVCGNVSVQPEEK